MWSQMIDQTNILWLAGFTQKDVFTNPHSILYRFNKAMCATKESNDTSLMVINVMGSRLNVKNNLSILSVDTQNIQLNVRRMSRSGLKSVKMMNFTFPLSLSKECNVAEL